MRDLRPQVVLAFRTQHGALGWARSSASPEYAGISYFELHVADAPAEVPVSAALVGTGSLFARSDNENLGTPLRRTLFRARIWRPSLVPAGMLGAVVAGEGGRWGRAVE